MICFNGGTPDQNLSCICPPLTYGDLCYFECVNGDWDPLQLTCTCLPGFGGSACDLGEAETGLGGSLSFVFIILFVFLCCPAIICFCGEKLCKLLGKSPSQGWRGSRRGYYEPQTQLYEVSEAPDTVVIYCSENGSSDAAINHVVLTRAIRYRSDTDRNVENIVDKPPEYESLFEANNQPPSYEEARRQDSSPTKN